MSSPPLRACVGPIGSRHCSREGAGELGAIERGVRAPALGQADAKGGPLVIVIARDAGALRRRSVAAAPAGGRKRPRALQPTASRGRGAGTAGARGGRSAPTGAAAGSAAA